MVKCENCLHVHVCLSAARKTLDHCNDYLTADDVKSSRTDLSHVMLIEVKHQLGPYEMDEVVLFNQNHLTQEEALRLVNAGEYHPSVLTLPKRQWESLFLNRKEG